MLKPGDEAPAFELPNADIHMTRLSDYLGEKNLVLYFYPKDDTPGCTIEALEFSDLLDEFSQMETEIIGISRDSCVSHGDFRDKHGLTIRLLADVEGTMCEDYFVWREKEAHGEKRMGILRSTFIVDKQGTIRYADYAVKPKGHAQEILNKVEALSL